MCFIFALAACQKSVCKDHIITKYFISLRGKHTYQASIVKTSNFCVVQQKRAFSLWRYAEDLLYFVHVFSNKQIQTIMMFSKESNFKLKCVMLVFCYCFITISHNIQLGIKLTCQT